MVNQRRSFSKSRLTESGEIDKLISITTQVYSSQWAALSVLAKLRGETVAELVRDSLDLYLLERALRPKLVTQIGALFKAEVSQVIGKHIAEENEKAKAELQALRDILTKLIQVLAERTENNEAAQAAMRRELDQLLDFFQSKHVNIRRG